MNPIISNQQLRSNQTVDLNYIYVCEGVGAFPFSKLGRFEQGKMQNQHHQSDFLSRNYTENSAVCEITKPCLL